MESWLVIGESGTASGGTGPVPVVAATDLEVVTGWVSKAEGWCRGAECIPASSIGSGAADSDLPVSLVVSGLGCATAADPVHRVAVIGSRSRARAGVGTVVDPDLELTGLDGASHRLLGSPSDKTLVVAFSSWCGCRYDLPGWQALSDELSDNRFKVVAVAIDECTGDVEPWAENIDLPVLVDTDRLFADALGLTNVPTVFWLDESGRVVRRPSEEFPTDMFTEVHGIESGPHLDAVRRWVLYDELPDPDGDQVPEFTDDQRQARVEFRLALELLRRGATEAAAERISQADALAPDDFTIWRAGMKLVGDDPFGAEFFERYTEWQQRHGGPLAASE